ncbi:zinc-binding dehydrogenase [Nocardia gipuzkoensis]|uniref:zinc-binding dehydrogenase n=1 Tax=Nocardia gipuzkoensis TaxID=2749991 RepID=UPI00237D97EE|nr:zinc-binding dehydrogenase [Nocardia gipuzkoensis]MDE1674998.1 zinc-binding dehydrogenase [Nocardia gipuzkoensis]
MLVEVGAVRPVIGCWSRRPPVASGISRYRSRNRSGPTSSAPPSGPSTSSCAPRALTRSCGEPALRTLETLVPGGILVNSQAAWTPGMHKRARQLGVRASGFLVEPDRANSEAIADLSAKRELAAHIETVFPLERAADAHRSIELHRTTGKIVLTVTDA